MLIYRLQAAASMADGRDVTGRKVVQGCRSPIPGA